MRVPRPSHFTRVFRRAYRQALVGATDGVIGGYITADGTPGLVPFTRGGLPDHSTAVEKGVIPNNVVGGFSVLLDGQGRAVAVLFRSVLNSAEIGFELPLEYQAAIIHAVPDKSSQFRVLKCANCNPSIICADDGAKHRAGGWVTKCWHLPS